MTETIEHDFGPTPSEIPPPDRTLLESWSKLLDSIEGVRAEKLTPQDASRILRNWPPVKTQELTRYQDLYYSYLTEMREILRIEIDSDPKCLENTDDDAVDNKGHYLNLLLLWQLQINQWGRDWDSDDDYAHIEMAAMAEAQQFFFGANGLLQHLDSIQFEMTEEDSNMLADALIEAEGA